VSHGPKSRVSNFEFLVSDSALPLLLHYN
jgi:hypothetical protein